MWRWCVFMQSPTYSLTHSLTGTACHVIISFPLFPHSTKNMQTVRQWCRIFATPERFLGRARGPPKLLINFFVERPVGVVHMLG